MGGYRCGHLSGLYVSMEYDNTGNRDDKSAKNNQGLKSSTQCVKIIRESA